MPRQRVYRKVSNKYCTDCHKKVAIAAKRCSCGYMFVKSPVPPAFDQDFLPDDVGGGELSGTKGNSSERPRRTERVRRVRPDYFNAMEFITYRGNKKGRGGGRIPGIPEDSGKRRRGRPRGASNRPKDDDVKEKEEKEKEDPFRNLSAEKTIQYKIILAELNRKNMSQNFKPT